MLFHAPKLYSIKCDNIINHTFKRKALKVFKKSIRNIIFLNQVKVNSNLITKCQLEKLQEFVISELDGKLILSPKSENNSIYMNIIYIAKEPLPHLLKNFI